MPFFGDLRRVLQWNLLAAARRSWVIGGCRGLDSLAYLGWFLPKNDMHVDGNGWKCNHQPRIPIWLRPNELDISCNEWCPAVINGFISQLTGYILCLPEVLVIGVRNQLNYHRSGIHLIKSPLFWVKSKSLLSIWGTSLFVPIPSPMAAGSLGSPAAQEGLVPEGFMMPLVSRNHVDRSAAWLRA